MKRILTTIGFATIMVFMFATTALARPATLQNLVVSSNTTVTTQYLWGLPYEIPVFPDYNTGEFNRTLVGQVGSATLSVEPYGSADVPSLETAVRVQADVSSRSRGTDVTVSLQAFVNGRWGRSFTEQTYSVSAGGQLDETIVFTPVSGATKYRAIVNKTRVETTPVTTTDDINRQVIVEWKGQEAYGFTWLNDGNQLFTAGDTLAPIVVRYKNDFAVEAPYGLVVDVTVKTLDGEVLAASQARWNDYTSFVFP